MKSNLEFNIIFTPGTVKYLRLAVLTLLENSPYTYRLVANALTMDELAVLKRFCLSSPRLEIYCLPGKKLLPHGVVVSLMLQKTNTEYFSIADSDVFALNDFSVGLEEQIKKYDIFSCCDYAWSPPGTEGTKEESFGKLYVDNIQLPTTFFCVYRTEVLRNILNHSGLFYERYQSWEHIPDDVINILTANHIDWPQFDTGKLVSLCAHFSGYKINHIPTQNLMHIGGISNSFNSKRKSPNKPSSGLKKYFQLKSSKHHKSAERSSTRQVLSDYVAEYLKYIFSERELPEYPASQKESEQFVKSTCDTLHKIHHKYKNLLD